MPIHSTTIFVHLVLRSDSIQDNDGLSQQGENSGGQGKIWKCRSGKIGLRVMLWKVKGLLQPLVKVLEGTAVVFAVEERAPGKQVLIDGFLLSQVFQTVLGTDRTKLVV